MDRCAMDPDLPGRVPGLLLPPLTMAPAVHTPPPRIQPGRSARVLYVDDEELNRLLMVALLERRSGVELTLAVDGTSGLAAARAAPPDLLLLDMRLPDMSGLQLLQALRTVPLLAHVPCVAVSANAMPDDIAEALRGGFDAYITKPIASAQLYGEIERLLAPARA